MTATITGQRLGAEVSSHFPEAVVDVSDGAVWLQPASIAKVCAYLRDDESHQFALLSSVTAVDYVDHFEVVYRLTSIVNNTSTVLKVRLPGREDPALPSVAGVWLGANLQEREIYDLMGVRFEGHPNLKRILTWEGFEGHPLRRDYLEPPLPYTWPHGG